MSHFTVLVIGDDPDALLAPYDENIVMDPPIMEYTRDEAIAKSKEDVRWYAEEGPYFLYKSDPSDYARKYASNKAHMNYLVNEFPERLTWTDDQHYESVRRLYEDEHVDDHGNLFTTYNPKSKWDWYVEGGRWDGVLTTKDGEGVNSGLVEDLNLTNTSCWAILDDSGWHERGQMGWFGLSIDEFNEDEWKDRVSKYLSELPPYAKITLIDAHI